METRTINVSHNHGKLVHEVNEHKVDGIGSIILLVAMHRHYTSLDANYASRFAKTNYRLK